jgi:hypothetical protein
MANPFQLALFRPARQQIPVEQPIDLFFNRPAHTTLLRVGTEAWPIGQFAIQQAAYACSIAKQPQSCREDTLLCVNTFTAWRILVRNQRSLAL